MRECRPGSLTTETGTDAAKRLDDDEKARFNLGLAGSEATRADHDATPGDRALPTGQASGPAWRCAPAPVRTAHSPCLRSVGHLAFALCEPGIFFRLAAGSREWVRQVPS